MLPKLTHLSAVGETYGNFKVTRVIEIHELQCILRELVHIPTGAQIMHIANDDPDNLFCLSFRTTPDSSNGVAHILEHTVLCGSKKYPVKDPFFAMTRRSLNTFMNAFTGTDFTCYPASSQVPKDFYNLLEVYLDAVFHPNLNQLSFLQEGHRLEFAVEGDPHSPLTYKGIVFNEMKGAMTSSTTRLMESLHQALFPDITYGYNSGGDPKEIPKLSYKELCEFHQKYYQPSHCLFFFYGNMPLEQHLDFIEKQTLKDSKKLQPLSPIGNQPRLTAPLQIEGEYPISPDEDSSDKAIIAFGWLTCHILNQEELLALTILEIVLMDTDASPLKLALLKSGLCKQVSASIDVEMSEVPVIATLRGCDPEDADKLEAVLRGTLKEIADHGIPMEQVENALHQLEFFRSEIGGNHAPFGLSLFMRSALLKQHGGNPEDALKIHSLFDQVRKRFLRDPLYLSQLIHQYFLDNPHFVRLVMLPKVNLNELEEEQERQLLNKMRQELSEKQVKGILKQTQELSQFQEKQADIDVDILPKISLEDVPVTSRIYPITQEVAGPLHLFHHNCFTNDITYADLVYNLPKIQEDELELVRLFTTLIAQMGCGKRTYAETLDYIQANTGGVGAYLSLNLQVVNPNSFVPTIGIRGKALYHKTNKLFPLMRDMIESIDFSDIGRLKEVILKQYISLQSSFNQNAMRYASQMAASSISVPSRISNAWNGIDYYRKIKQIAENIDVEIHPLSEKLRQLHGRLLGLQDPHLILSCDTKTYSELKQHKFYGLEDIETKSSITWQADFPLKKIERIGYPIASPVAFLTHIFKTVPYLHPDTPALGVAAGLFDNLVLHQRIREQGGAYGAGAVNHSLSGTFSFYAYRDPNISNSIIAIEEAIQSILNGEFEESDLEEAKLEIVQGLDAPVAPGSRADLAYSWYREGKTSEMRQAFRNRLLALTASDVIQAIKQHIVPAFDSGATVVFAGRELLEKENKALTAMHKQPFDIASVFN